MRGGERLYSSGGEDPRHSDGIPRRRLITEFPHPRRAKEEAWEFLKDHQYLLREAREKGMDVVAWTKRHGTEILLGAGAAAIIGAVIIRKHKQRKK